jgi:putative glutamine amidotransferase
MKVVRPRIALTLSRRSALHQASHDRYRDALARAGADVVALHPGDDIPDDVDGVLLSGGGDIAPARYGDQETDCRDVDAERDELELQIARTAIERDLPVLGICRGFQMLNVVRGGKLVQDVPGHNPAEREGLVRHSGVEVREGSRLAEATGARTIDVNSRHHQAVTEELLGRGLTATATVGGLVEAFEATDRRWVVGVQWHPERTDEVAPEARRIFGAFVAAAAARTTTPAR